MKKITINKVVVASVAVGFLASPLSPMNSLNIMNCMA